MSWLSGWLYRKAIVIAHTADGAQTDYQMKLLVGESSGATGEQVDCGGHVASDFDDLRFTTSDGTTLCDYWIESITGTTPNQLATVWVKIPSIAAHPDDTTIYMYYSGTTTAVSSITATFPFADHFDDASIDGDKWYHWVDNGSESESGTELAITGDPAYNAWGAKTKYGTNYAFRGRVYISAESGSDVALFWGDERSADGTASGSADGAGFRITAASNRNYGTSDNAGTTLTDRSDSITSFAILEVQRNSTTNVRMLINDALKATHTTNLPSVDIGFLFYADSAVTLHIDWVVVRKYTDNEPTWGSFGGTELCITLTDCIKLNEPISICDTDLGTDLTSAAGFGINPPDSMGTGVIASIKWNGTYWLIGGWNYTGGEAMTKTPRLVKYDGSSFTDLSSSLIGYGANEYVNCIAWNGTIWLIISDGGVFNIYDGSTITLEYGNPMAGAMHWFCEYGDGYWLYSPDNLAALYKWDGVDTYTRIEGLPNFADAPSSAKWNGTFWLISGWKGGLVKWDGDSTFTDLSSNVPSNPDSWSCVYWDGANWFYSSLSGGKPVLYKWDGGSVWTDLSSSIPANTTATYVPEMESTGSVLFYTSNKYLYFYDGVDFWYEDFEIDSTYPIVIGGWNETYLLVANSGGKLHKITPIAKPMSATVILLKIKNLIDTIFIVPSITIWEEGKQQVETMLTVSDLVIRSSFKTMSDSISLAEALTISRLLYRNMVEVVSIGCEIIKVITKPISEIILTSGVISIVKKITLLSAVALVESRLMVINLSRSSTINLIGNASKSLSTIKNDIIVAIEGVTKLATFRREVDMRITAEQYIDMYITLEGGGDL